MAKEKWRVLPNKLHDSKSKKPFPTECQRMLAEIISSTFAEAPIENPYKNVHALVAQEVGELTNTDQNTQNAMADRELYSFLEKCLDLKKKYENEVLQFSASDIPRKH